MNICMYIQYDKMEGDCCLNEKIFMRNSFSLFSYVYSEFVGIR